MSEYLDKCFSPAQLNGLQLRNRIIKAATFEGMTPMGVPGQVLHDFHTGIVKGGTAMTTVAYCAAEADGRVMEEMMYMHEGVRPQLEKLAAEVHAAGGAMSGQLGHCGNFTQNKQFTRRIPRGPSPAFNLAGVPYGLPYAGAMRAQDMNDLVRCFHDAASFMKSVGFDAIEIHFGHGYGLSQFISPKTNKRKDEYGGSIENRMRLPLRCLDAVREAVGSEFPLLGKMNLTDGAKGGLEIDEAVKVAAMLDQGGIDALIPSGGTSSMNPMLLFRGGNIWGPLMANEPNWFLKAGIFIMKPIMFHDYPYQELYFLDGARRVRDAVKNAKICYIGGVSSMESIETAMKEFDFIQMGRALIADPELVNRASADHGYQNYCTHCNKCATLIKVPGGIYCVELNPRS